MKKIILIFMLFAFANIYAQKIRPYAGFVTYLHTDFSNSVFFNIKTGGEFKLSKYIKPEIEISMIGGGLEDVTKRNENIILEEYTRSVTSINYSFCPKIILGNNAELQSYFVILPRYSISNIEANSNLSIYNNTGHLTEYKHKNAKVWSHSVSFAIGYNFDISNENPDSLCFILDLQGIELGDALNQFNANQSRVLTKWTLGLGLNYYLNFKKKKV